MSLERFKNTLIPLPPLEEQKRIVEKLDLLIPQIKELSFLIDNQ